MGLGHSIYGGTPILTAVFDVYRAYVHVRYHVAVYSHVLSYHEPESKEEKRKKNEEKHTQKTKRKTHVNSANDKGKVDDKIKSVGLWVLVGF